MKHFRLCLFSWLSVLALVLWADATQATEFRYRYVSLDEVRLPDGFVFFDPAKITNSGRIYGTAYECRPVDTCDEIISHVSVYSNGAVTIFERGFVTTANEGGTIGGGVLLDPENFTTQAALFRGNSVELIPPQPGEYSSFVIALNDLGVAVVESSNALGETTYLLYDNGKSTVIKRRGGINNAGIMAGRKLDGSVYRGFRFNSRTGIETTLYPLPTEPHAWGVGINNRGDVLGYSFFFGGKERIGVWDRAGVFRTYFVEGIPEFPTISNRLLFNDNNLIVIATVTNPPAEYGNGYIVPRPGVRLNLADITENAPQGRGAFFFIWSVNNHGDIIGSGLFGGSFLLKRLEDGTAQTAVTKSSRTQPSAQSNIRHANPKLCALRARARLAMASLARPAAKTYAASFCQ